MEIRFKQRELNLMKFIIYLQSTEFERAYTFYIKFDIF